LSAIRCGSGNFNPDRLKAESFIISNFLERRIPVPVTSFLGIADVHDTPVLNEDLSRSILENLYEKLQPVAITSEDLKRENISSLISSAIKEVNSTLREKTEQGNTQRAISASLTLALTTRSSAFIGHIGKNRIFLLHDDRLFDLTPSKSYGSQKEEDETLPLFENLTSPLNGGKKNGEPRAAPTDSLLGQEKIFPGYNEVALTPGDILIICSDGMCRSVKEKEIAEVFLSSINVARACRALENIARRRNSDSSATIIAWKYNIQSLSASTKRGNGISRKRRKTRSKISSALVTFTLAIVLFLLFAFGFAIGWRITDAFMGKNRGISTEPTERTESQDVIKTEPPEANAENTKQTQTQNPANAQTGISATVTESGVRVRSALGTQTTVLGLLAKGETVTITERTTSPDGKTWYKIKGYVHAGGQRKIIEGYVRSDFVKATLQQ